MEETTKEPMLEINSKNLEDLEKFVQSIGEKPFRARQIFSWLHEKNVPSFDYMTSLPKKFREQLAEISYISQITMADKYISNTDYTTKYLFDVGDSNIIESVLMKHDFGYSVCVSTQVGCKMGCKFCASSIGGLRRNLSAGEIAAQVYAISADSGVRISNVTVMGCGEPLDNYENLVQFIKIINSEYGVNISQRRITVSTCGIIDKIYKLTEEDFNITLAVSLHAPNDSVRKLIMPAANKYPLDALLEACEYYVAKTNRRMTFEYALIAGVNDSPRHARELARKIRKILCHVNLIPLNNIAEHNLRSGNLDFARFLKRDGIETTVRRGTGDDINAACGQLRSNWSKTAADHQP